MSWFEWRDAPEAEFAVIGDPIGHSLSPAMFGAAFRSRGDSFRYVAIRVPVAEFEDALDHLIALGYVGINVTLPLKELAAQWCGKLEPEAQQIGAVNAIRTLDSAGNNTDWIGIVATLQALGILNDRGALVLGAGGTARATLVALREFGVETKVWNRTPERAHQMVNSMGLNVEICGEIDPGAYGVLINTTSAHLAGADLPISWEGSQPGAAFDVAYGSQATFLTSAAAAGWKTADGALMLARQGQAAFEWWTEVELDLDGMLRAIREASHDT